ncbi:hypothetical protein [Duncaniella freteri]|nr:hypothetical protein [Duncaniella freteri]
MRPSGGRQSTVRRSDCPPFEELKRYLATTTESGCVAYLRFHP